jgi:hypothetical protein
VRSETVRYGLKFAWGWLPAGAVVALLVLLRRRQPTLALALTAMLAVLALKTYDAFFVHSTVAQMAVYAVPLAAAFLVRLHLVELAPNRTAALLGVVWLAFLAAVGIGLTVKDARKESAIVRGPGGALATTPDRAEVYRDVLEWLTAGTAPGEPVLIAPQLTSLYTLADRESPLRQLSLLPGALPQPADERAAIERLKEANVRMAVIDERSYPEYGHTTFGDSFDRNLARYLRSDFVPAARLRTGDPDTPAISVLVRRPE